MFRIGVLGDIHTYIDTADVALFNSTAYDLLLVTGDLGNFRDGEALATAVTLSQLTCPTLLIPGNHDLLSMPQFLAELRGPEALKQLTARGQAGRVAALTAALGPITTGGYSRHVFRTASGALTVIVARPFSFGGPSLACRAYLTATYGVDSLDASAAKLCALVDQTDTRDLLFLAHNGPTGLGNTADALWGCDFRPELGDFGDLDLRSAIDYAQATGRRVCAVVAGHMHHALLTGGQRRWLAQDDGITYVNAARVPRIFTRDGQRLRHHVRLDIDDDAVTVTAVERTI